jgi:hypothetical protein
MMHRVRIEVLVTICAYSVQISSVPAAYAKIGNYHRAKAMEEKNLERIAREIDESPTPEEMEPLEPTDPRDEDPHRGEESVSQASLSDLLTAVGQKILKLLVIEKEQ